MWHPLLQSEFQISFSHVMYCIFDVLYFSDCSRNSRIPAETVPLSDPLSATRVLCGALILPTIATIVGKLMFGSVQSNFQRTLLVCMISPVNLPDCFLLRGLDQLYLAASRKRHQIIQNLYRIVFLCPRSEMTSVLAFHLSKQNLGHAALTFQPVSFANFRCTL